MNIVSEIFALIAVILLCCSYQQTKKEKFLKIQILANISYGIQYALLKGYAAVVADIIATIRCIAFYQYEKKDKSIPFSILLCIIGISLILGIVTCTTIYSIIPIIISIIYSIGCWQKRLKVTYIIGIITCILWIIYDIIIGAHIAIIGCIIEFISIIVGIKNLLNHQKKQQENKN